MRCKHREKKCASKKEKWNTTETGTALSIWNKPITRGPNNWYGKGPKTEKEKIKRKESKNKYDFGYFVELSISPIPSYLKLFEV